MRHAAVFMPLALALTALVAGCTGPGTYPSLAIRPAERAYGEGRPVEPAAQAGQSQAGDTPVSPDAPVAGQIAALRANAAAAHRRFLDRKPEADRLTAAARRGAAGGEAWSVAQVALARLESARNDTSIALADLDAMLVSAQLASATAPSPDLATVRAAHDEVGVLVAGESATIDQFAARLKG